MAMDDLIEVCVKNMASAEHPGNEVRSYLRDMLPKLDYWKRHSELSDGGAFESVFSRCSKNGICTIPVPSSFETNQIR